MWAWNGFPEVSDIKTSALTELFPVWICHFWTALGVEGFWLMAFYSSVVIDSNTTALLTASRIHCHSRCGPVHRFLEMLRCSFSPMESSTCGHAQGFWGTSGKCHEACPLRKAWQQLQIRGSTIRWQWSLIICMLRDITTIPERIERGPVHIFFSRL